MPSPVALEPLGPFSLAAARRMLGAFGPGAGGGGDGVDLAFRLDDGLVACAHVEQQDGAVHVTSLGAGAPDAVAARVARLLSLDHDGRGWPVAAGRDPVLAAVAREADWLRPVLFASPFEAAAWAVLTQRTSMTHARAVWRRLVAALGDRVTLEGREHDVFPSPAAIHAAPELPGVAGPRVARLRGLAEAALDGVLDVDALRAVPAPEALARLRALPGIGPFSAELTLLRGAGVVDVLPLAEPRLRRAVGAAYGLGRPADDDVLRALAEPWRPFRTWAAVLLRAASDA